MLGKVKGNKLFESIDDYVVFDLETTGCNCNRDCVIEISAVKVKCGQVCDEFTSLVNPERPIPYYASKVNGITDRMVADAPVFEEVLPKFIEFIEDLPLVGHNINMFDMRFIYRDCEKFLKQIPGNDFIDTLALSRKLVPELHNHKLSDMAEFYGISTEGAHRALNDCRMNQVVYERLRERIK